MDLVYSQNIDFRSDSINSSQVLWVRLGSFALYVIQLRRPEPFRIVCLCVCSQNSPHPKKSFPLYMDTCFGFVYITKAFLHNY